MSSESERKDSAQRPVTEMSQLPVALANFRCMQLMLQLLLVACIKVGSVGFDLLQASFEVKILATGRLAQSHGLR